MPLVIDLFCGLGGFSAGFLAEGYDCIGFDIERHDYGTGGYPGQLVLQDVLTLHGSQLKDADCIVASPPCTEYSYMAMPWSRGKQIAAALRGQGEFPKGYTGSRTIPELNALFDACFRIQREACEAAGRDIPLIVENVRGAQPWVGPARWSWGSFYLWGDVPALMPTVRSIKNNGGSWFAIANNTTSGHRQNPDGRKVPGRNFHFPEKYGIPSPSFHGADHELSVQSALAVKVAGINLTNVGFNVAAAQRLRENQKTIGHLNKRDGHTHTRHLTNQREHLPRKERPDYPYSPGDSRKAASAQIAKIPFALSSYIARVYKPERIERYPLDSVRAEATA